jgi:DNA-binding MarR family transcriptional regulator
VEERAQETAIGLSWDALTGQWRLVGTAAQMRMSVERHHIIDVLKKAGKPLSPNQIALALQKNSSTVRTLLEKMVEQGQVKADGFNYTPPDE